MFASKTWRWLGACLRTEQKLSRELFFFACCHLILELVLSAVLQVQMSPENE